MNWQTNTGSRKVSEARCLVRIKAYHRLRK